ncbi:MAG: PQQ-dependent sugar dehydrogenase, partial [Anaerolineae bacterium]|nr:PQQ-dependent sugar dehydrogenase [Anaerolineae bacterium]
MYGQGVIASAQEDAFDWKSDWAVADDFSINIDTEGYSLPTAIAFVPNPGDDPKDPLYFVTEIRGQVKVVTNDRTIYTFAEDFFDLQVKEELPSGQGQGGLAGICLEPEHGYVYVTFSYQDKAKILRNNIMRFETEPGTFAIKPSSQTAFTDIFVNAESGLAHQIGPCQINNDLLYVSVGEAWQTSKSQDLDVMVGKVIRMTLDGKPVPENPFYEDDDISKTANFVWAYGLRNPFSLKIVDDRVFVADNGQNIDRFMELHEGQNYFWNGNDWSIATNADFIFSPSLAPAQMDYLSGDSTLFPEEYGNTFFLAISGWVARGKIPGIVTLKYGLDENRLVAVPEYFLKYRSSPEQTLAGLAFGPDGLYIVPILPNQAGETAILKIAYEPDVGHPFQVMQTDDPKALLTEKGCLGCHSIGNEGGFGGAAGPNLERDPLVERLQARLDAPSYKLVVDEANKLDREPFISYKEAREEVLAAEGMDKVKSWVKYHILEPKFDNAYSQMPNMGLTEQEASLVTDYLLKPNQEDTDQSFLTSLRKQLLPRDLSGRHLIFSFAIGFVVAVLLGVAWWLVRTFIWK